MKLINSQSIQNKIPFLCFYIRQDLQHPGVPVDRGKLPPNCSHLLCQTHTWDGGPQRKVHLQQWWSAITVSGWVEEGENWNLYYLTGLNVKKKNEKIKIVQPCHTVVAYFLLSGQMWPGEHTAGDGCHVWRRSSCMYAGSSRGRTSLV